MRTEVRRGRKFIEYHDPDTQPEGTFTQEIGAHDVSYLDTDGKWKEVDENWLTDGADGYIVKADKLNHKVRLKSNGGRAWYPRRNVDTEYLTFGIPQYWTGSKWSNFGFSGWSVSGKTITLKTRQNVTILVHSLWSGIKIDWVLANASAPKRMRYPVTLTGITESAGVLHGADGSELGRLTPTTATDANGLELACSGVYSGGFVEFSADVTGAVYPVTVDPDFASGASYGQVYGGGPTYATARTTSYGSAVNKLQLGQTYPGAYWVYRNYVQFDTSSITSSNTIAQVNLRMVIIQDASTTADFDVQIVKYDWSSQDPLASGNREAAYDGCLAADADDSIWRNTNGISKNTQYTSGNLATDWVNKTGTTYYGLRSSRDVSASAPSGNEYVLLATPADATASYRPTLIVAYTSTAQNLTLACDAGSYTQTGTAATLSVKRNYTLTCAAGSYTATGTAATLTVQRNYALACASGSYSLTGADTSFVIQRHYTLSAGSGSYTLTGTAAALAVQRNYSLACDAGTYTLSGTAATFTIVRHYTLSADAGSYALTGTSATLSVHRNFSVSLDAGSYALNGTAAAFEVIRHYTLTCDAGVYTLTGTDVTFGGSTAYVLSCAAGSYSLTGSDVTLTVQHNYSLTCGSASYTLAGSLVGITFGWTLACAASSYALTGADATFDVRHNYALICESGNYVLTGTSAGIYFAYVMALGVGAYGLTGAEATLIFVTGFDYAEYWDGYVCLSSTIAANVLMNRAVNASVKRGTNFEGSAVLNVEVDNSAVMNREINQPNYSELEEL